MSPQRLTKKKIVAQIVPPLETRPHSISDVISGRIPPPRRNSTSSYSISRFLISCLTIRSFIFIGAYSNEKSTKILSSIIRLGLVHGEGRGKMGRIILNNALRTIVNAERRKKSMVELKPISTVMASFLKVMRCHGNSSTLLSFMDIFFYFYVICYMNTSYAMASLF